jgi:hypothetical protein
MTKLWHEDPLVSRDLEQRRTNLAIKYLTRIERWLLLHQSGHKMKTFFEKMQLVLTGKVSKLSFNMLNGLEQSAKKFLDFERPHRVLCEIDLTSDASDDDEPTEVEPENSMIVPDSPPNSPLREDQRNSERHFSPSPPLVITQPVPEPFASTSYHLPDLPSAAAVEASFLDSPFSNFSSPPPPVLPENNNSFISISPPVLPESIHTSTTIPQRRKSILIPPKDQPSIQDYKLKRQILKPPGIYAKPKEQDTATRNIITVPYKTAPRPAPPPMDPREEAMKLAGVKEKIYMNNYLHIDAAKKEEMQKREERQKEKAAKKLSSAKEPEDTETETEDDDINPVPPKKPRRDSISLQKLQKELAEVKKSREASIATKKLQKSSKVAKNPQRDSVSLKKLEKDLVVRKKSRELSIAASKQNKITESSKATQQQSCVVEKTPEKPAKSDSIERKRMTRCIVYSDSDDDKYVPPSHVFEDTEKELARIFGFEVPEPEKGNIEVEPKQPDMKKRQKSVAAKDKTEQPKKRLCSESSTSSVEPSVASTSAASTPSLSEKRQTRSKSMMLEPMQLNLPDEVDGLEVLSKPIRVNKKEVKKKPKPKPKPQVYPKSNFARKRGRPVNFQSNILPQAATSALKLPSDTIFSPPRKSPNEDREDDTDFLDGSLLIEVPGSMKILKRTTELRPRWERRKEVDEAPMPLIEPKQEPPDM